MITDKWNEIKFLEQAFALMLENNKNSGGGGQRERNVYLINNAETIGYFFVEENIIYSPNNIQKS